MSIKITRRGAIKAGAGLATAFAMPSIVSAAGDKKFAGKTIRLLTWSDNTGLAVLNHIAKPFEEKTGA